MAGGGLYVLVAYGSQNVILSGNPDFTYFYTVMKKYSHFSFESVTIPLEGPQELFFDQPIKLRAKIQRVADLLTDIYFTFTIPDIYSKFTSIAGRPQYEFQWVRYLGAQIIQSAEFLVGGTQVQQFDSDYLISTAYTDLNETAFYKWRKLVGDVPELYDPANGAYSGIAGGTNSARVPGLYPNVYGDPTVTGPQNNFPSIRGRDITMPLSFWFSGAYNLALPLIALQYHECEIQLTLRPIQDLYTVKDINGFRVRPGFNVVATPAQLETGVINYTNTTEDGIYIRQYLTDVGFTAPSLNTWPLNPRLQTTQVYLTDDERRTFATKPLNYIVRQVTQYAFPGISSRQLFNLYTHNPVPRILVLPRRSDCVTYLNAWTNFTNWWQYPNAPFVPTNSAIPLGGSSGLNGVALQEDIIRQMRILCDGNEIQEIKPVEYFNQLTSWKYADGIFPPGLVAYSFALHSSSYVKPSGSLNTSRVKNFQLDIDVWPLANGSPYLYNHAVYVESLNFFVVEGGMGGMKYAV